MVEGNTVRLAKAWYVQFAYQVLTYLQLVQTKVDPEKILVLKGKTPFFPRIWYYIITPADRTDIRTSKFLEDVITIRSTIWVKEIPNVSFEGMERIFFNISDKVTMDRLIEQYGNEET